MASCNGKLEGLAMKVGYYVHLANENSCFSHFAKVFCSLALTQTSLGPCYNAVTASFGRNSLL